jgi:hypothetical protein
VINPERSANTGPLLPIIAFSRRASRIESARTPVAKARVPPASTMRWTWFPWTLKCTTRKSGRRRAARSAASTIR